MHRWHERASGSQITLMIQSICVCGILFKSNVCFCLFLHVFAAHNKFEFGLFSEVRNEYAALRFLWSVWIYFAVYNIFCYYWMISVCTAELVLYAASLLLHCQNASRAPRWSAPPTRVCAPAMPKWPLRHWLESLKSLLHIAFKEKCHWVSVRNWYGDDEPWKIQSRLTAWKVKMRLALGFCGQFAKATFSSLSVKTLEVRQQIEVRGSVSAPRCSRAESLYSSSPTALVCSVRRFHVVWASSRQYGLSVIYGNIFFDDRRGTSSVSLLHK